jgi:hypothetical protein
MLKKDLNIANYKTMILIMGIIFLSLIISSCENCTNPDNGGINPDEEIFFTASPIGSEFPNIYSTNPKGDVINSKISNAMVFSSPSVNGTVAFIRKNKITGTNSLYVSKIDGSDIKLIASDNDIFTISYPTISPDGKNVVFNAGNSRLISTDNSSGSSNFNQMSSKLTNGCQPSFSGNSKFIAFFEGDGISAPITLKVIDAKSTDVVINIYSKILGNIKFSDNNDISINWSANSESIVFSVRNGENDDIYIINVISGIERIISVPNADIGGNNATLSPKDDYLAVSGRDGNIWLIFIATNDLRFSNITKSDGFERNHHPKWSHKGDKLIFNSTSQFDSEMYSTLVSAELKFDVALAQIVHSYILSNNAFIGFWNNAEFLNE